MKVRQVVRVEAMRAHLMVLNPGKVGEGFASLATRNLGFGVLGLGGLRVCPYTPTWPDRPCPGLSALT
jgi:hypothetical protein